MFETDDGVVGFSAHVRRHGIPTRGYHVDSALLRRDETLSRNSESQAGWREAVVIVGDEWRRLTNNLGSALAPAERGKGIYYQGLLADRFIYRDAEGLTRSTTSEEQAKDLVIESRFSAEETLQKLAGLIEAQLAQTHPRDSLFLLMAPDLKRFPQPLLLDDQQRQCVCLSPAALLDSSETGFSLATSAQGAAGLLFESHGLALVKNPISSAARLGDLGLATMVRLLRPPLPRGEPPALGHAKGMDLAQWEEWLDHYTGTRREAGSLELLIDGDRFYTRLQKATSDATNHISLELFIFDNDDVAVQMADLLKGRSSEVRVRVIMDQVASMAAGMLPPATPMPGDFVAPASISSYLRKDSQVQVRPFLNSWLLTDHSKVFLVDGAHAWLGGMNLAREYRFEWHDLMVEVSGPVVTSLERQFHRHWAHEGPLGDLSYALAPIAQPRNSIAPCGRGAGGKVRLLPTRTLWKPFSAAVQGSLHKAQSYIFVENPYLFDRRVIRGLVLARHRGVDVRVILPRVNDLKAGEHSNRVIANYLRAQGVRVYFYPGMTHVKALLVDDWACVGSGNLDHLSLRLCQEENLATSDPTFAASLKRELFEADFAHSYELPQPLEVSWVDLLTNLALEGF